MTSAPVKVLQLDISDLKEQSWTRVFIDQCILTVGRNTFSLDSGEVLRTKKLAKEEVLLTSCCFDGSTTVSDIIKTPQGLRIETHPPLRSRRTDILPLRMHRDVKDAIFCSDEVIAV